MAAETQRTGLDLLALNEASTSYKQQDPRAAELVKLRFFAGSNPEPGRQALGISVATADIDWAYAKGWLKAELAGTMRLRVKFEFSPESVRAFAGNCRTDSWETGQGEQIMVTSERSIEKAHF